MSHLNQFIKHCHDNLLHSKDTEVANANDYLAKRNIKPESILLHSIGYCSHKDIIPNEIAFYGKEEKDVGVNGKGYSYFIKGRLIVPVYSEFGLIVGFATRTPSFEPGNTWWNLSKPFHKSNHLFMLDKARQHVFKNDKIYLVEGYIDAILLYQEGLKGIVGLMGTNLSPRQVGLISRYCSNICLCLDVDKNNSGQKAQGKAIYSLKKFDFYESLSVVDGLPVGEDPDVFVTQHGLPELLKMERKLSGTEINRIYREALIQNKGR
jgi:DNA primase